MSPIIQGFFPLFALIFLKLCLLIFSPHLPKMSPLPRLIVIACSKCPLFNLGNLSAGQSISKITGDLNPRGEGRE